MGIFEKFKIGLGKSSKVFSEGFKKIIISKRINSETLDKLEDFLIESDVGVAAAQDIKKKFSGIKIDPNEDNLNQINILIENYIKDLMLPLEKIITNNENIKPKVLLIAGVNGVVKTSTI